MILPMLVFLFGQVVTNRWWKVEGNSTYFHLPWAQRCWSGIESVVVSGLAGWDNVSRGVLDNHSTSEECGATFYQCGSSHLDLQ